MSDQHVTRPPWTFGRRVAVYLGLAIVSVVLAGNLALADYDEQCRSKPEATDCDLGGLAVLDYGAVAFIVVAAVVVLVEIVHAAALRRIR